MRNLAVLASAGLIGALGVTGAPSAPFLDPSTTPTTVSVGAVPVQSRHAAVQAIPAEDPEAAVGVEALQAVRAEVPEAAVQAVRAVIAVATVLAAGAVGPVPPVLADARAVQAGGGPPAAQARWGWPLAPRPAVLKGFEPPLHDWLPGHRGVDLAADVGQSVLAAGNGVVGFSGSLAGVGIVTVLHANGLRTTYQPVVEPLARGTVVRRGQSIARVAASGGHCAPRTCLHWGLLRGDVYLDPLMLLGYGHAVLLPMTRGPAER